MQHITTASSPQIDLIDQQSDTISYARLAQVIVIQAAKDAKAGDPGALAWLMADETADIWFVLGHVRRSAVLRWCARHQAKRTAPAANRLGGTVLYLKNNNFDK